MQDSIVTGLPGCKKEFSITQVPESVKYSLVQESVVYYLCAKRCCVLPVCKKVLLRDYLARRV